MRISGGVFRGRRILVPEKAAAFRPTTERNRQMVFNVLRNLIEGSCFCDLFAGSGAMGLEALSRGADQAVFFETDPLLAASITRNLDELDIADRGFVLKQDAAEVAKTFPRPEKGFDVIFMDPPYEARPDKALENALQCLARGGVLAYEHSSRMEPVIPAGAELFARHGAGDSAISFLSAKGA